ncbi:hypothetical protein D3C72_2309350 [compost metagenome]
MCVWNVTREHLQPIEEQMRHVQLLSFLQHGMEIMMIRDFSKNTNMLTELGLKMMVQM